MEGSLTWTAWFSVVNPAPLKMTHPPGSKTPPDQTPLSLLPTSLLMSTLYPQHWPPGFPTWGPSHTPLPCLPSNVHIPHSAVCYNQLRSALRVLHLQEFCETVVNFQFNKFYIKNDCDKCSKLPNYFAPSCYYWALEVIPVYCTYMMDPSPVMWAALPNAMFSNFMLVAWNWP